MRIAFGNAKTMCGLLAFSGALSEAPSRSTPHYEPLPPGTPQQILMIRVSQESSPGAGDFDHNILGFTKALQSTGTAADFYEYGRAGPNYGNSEPVLTSNTSQLFFVNAADGLAFILVQNKPNSAETSTWGKAETRFELSGGTASLLKADDEEGEVFASDGGTMFTAKQEWSSTNTDGMVIGALPVGFTLLGQFTVPPTGLGGGWVVISGDGSKIPLSLVPGQRVRLDVALQVQVQVHQDH